MVAAFLMAVTAAVGLPPEAVAQVAPANDDFAAATVFASDDGSLVGETNVDATSEPGEPAHDGRSAGRSVWYSWTPSADGNALITVTPPMFPDFWAVVLAVYTGNAVDGLTEIEAVTYASDVEFQVSAGTTYHIAVDGYDPGESGPFDLAWSIPSPPNDNFADASVLAGDSGILPDQSNEYSTAEPGEPAHDGGSEGRSVWYSWTPSADGNALVTATTPMSTDAWDVVLAVYTGAAVDNLTEVQADTSLFTAAVELQVSAGTTYHLAVDGSDASGATPVGPFELGWSIPSPPNDHFADALVLDGGAGIVLDQSNEYSTVEAGEPVHDDHGVGRSVWYQWTPAKNGDAVVAITTPFDPDGWGGVVAIYTGSAVDNLTEVAAASSTLSRVEVAVSVSAGTTYHIAVDGHDASDANETGTFYLTWPPDVPVADDQSVSTWQDTAVPITLTGSVLGDDALTYAIDTASVHGDLSGTPPTVTYTPDPGFSGEDTFTFTTDDGQSTSNPGTVSVGVHSVAPDPGFGVDGAYISEFAGAASAAHSVVEQSDGTVLVAGWARPDEIPEVGESSSAVVAKLTAVGSLDPTFGVSGFARVEGRDNYFYDMIVQPDGKIVAVGYSKADIVVSGDPLVVRFEADGTLDTSFGANGTVMPDLDGRAETVALQPDGKILVGGGFFGGLLDPHDLGVVRLLANGDIDTAFGTNGVVRIFNAGDDLVSGVAVQPDGAIVLAGTIDQLNTWGDQDIALVRLLADGSLDATFGNAGEATIDLGTAESGRGLALQADGKILIVGDTLVPFNRAAVVVRTTASGVLDTSFGSGGVTEVSFGGDFEQFNDLALQADGRIVAAGSSGIDGDRDLIAARILADGSLDPSFDSGVNATFDLGDDEVARSVAVQTDGKILLAGQQAAEWAVVRLTSTEAVPEVQPGAGSVTEGDSGTVTLNVPVNLEFASSDTVTVDYATLPLAQPQEGIDYVAASGVVTFEPGETTQTIPITVYGDTVNEGFEFFGFYSEWLAIVLSSPTNATLPPGFLGNVAIGVILDDDPGVILPGSAVVDEGTGGSTVVSVPVTLSDPAEGTVTVDWTTVDVPTNPQVAASGSDYVAAAGTVTFGPGETTQYVDITILGDAVDEPPLLYGEWALISYSNPSGNATIDTTFFGLGVVVIIDDD